MRNVMGIVLGVGVAETIAGLNVGCWLLYFRQGVLRGVEFLTGQPLWEPSIRFLTELPSKPDPVEITEIVIMVIVFSFIATHYPAYKAANNEPVTVMSYE